MKTFPPRCSLRLQGCDYTQNDACFVALCMFRRNCILL